MRLCLTDFPHYVPYQEYKNSIAHVVDILKGYESVNTIYQVGSIGNPGISDIDILIVFKEGLSCYENPLKGLKRSEKYLFLHNLYGISKKNFPEAELYFFFDNYNHLWGEDIILKGKRYASHEIQILKSQIALEYLLKMYINLTISLTYGIIRTRQLLLHAKALIKDLDFLDIKRGKIVTRLNILAEWRKSWFKERPKIEIISNWVSDFYNELGLFLCDIFKRLKFYTPKSPPFFIARNIEIVNSELIDFIHKGIHFPSTFGWLGRKYFNLQHRINMFQFGLPIYSTELPLMIMKRFEFQKKIKEYNSQRLRHFMPPISCLNIL